MAANGLAGPAGQGRAHSGTFWRRGEGTGVGRAPRAALTDRFAKGTENRRREGVIPAAPLWVPLHRERERARVLELHRLDEAVRGVRDRDALRAGLASGALSVLCSDHQPHEPDAKQAPFGDTEPGVSGLDTLLALGLRLVRDGSLPLPTLLGLSERVVG